MENFEILLDLHVLDFEFSKKTTLQLTDMLYFKSSIDDAISWYNKATFFLIFLKLEIILDLPKNM